MRNIQIGIVAIMAIWGKLIFVLAINSQSNHLGYDDIQRAFKKGRCQSCHPSIWREWERSFHAKAWTDPIYQQAASQIPNREETCDPCHAPEPVLSTGLGKMPKLRDADRESGCLIRMRMLILAWRIQETATKCYYATRRRGGTHLLVYRLNANSSLLNKNER